ncbi:hemolysin type calcium-binding protein [Rivihabitans pingtungensis]|uniref:Hemolysin type calcium-binding protein n=3 Tax=Rivihabitans pingtungensis TaxID=1054498 RepID=A0A318KDD8_9NEIS|nr:hemolysin type calcium-binding protein [Rivihabitans pingtungensis]
MTSKVGSEGNDIFNMGSLQMSPGETAHSYDALGGDDIVYGSSYVDFIHGGAGNDQLFGYGGDDALLGWSGNDTLQGGDGNDLLHGGDGDDVLYGGAGADALLGGFGDDFYVQYIGYGNGRDTINDGVTASYTPGYGGGNGDTLYLPNVLLSQVYVARQADNLWLSSMADASDGQITEGVVITNFFQGGIYTIEYLRTQDAVISLSGAFGVV